MSGRNQGYPMQSLRFDEDPTKRPLIRNNNFDDDYDHTFSARCANSLELIVRVVCLSVFLGGVGALGVAAVGSGGGKVLASWGHRDYDPIDLAKEGAAGGAVVAGGLTLILAVPCHAKELLAAIFTNLTLFKTALYTALTMGSAFTGKAVLEALGEDTFSWEETASSFGVGCAILFPTLFAVNYCLSRSKNPERSTIDYLV